jgi:hypothetical protein
VAVWIAGVNGKEALFFFEKKNQKTFTFWGPSHATMAGRPKLDKSLFASFSSEKEALLAFIFLL